MAENTCSGSARASSRCRSRDLPSALGQLARQGFWVVRRQPAHEVAADISGRARVDEGAVAEKRDELAALGRSRGHDLMGAIAGPGSGRGGIALLDTRGVGTGV